MTPKRESLTVIQNFKVTPTVETAITADSQEMGLTTSEYLRLCVYLGGPLLRACPPLKNLNRRELEELAANIGNTLVIRPATVEWRKP